MNARVEQRRPPAGRKDRIGIVGAGIVGSSIAYQLTRRGANVTVFEKSRPAAGVTEKSFAWVNATFAKEPDHYHMLNRLGSASWLNLEHLLAGELRLQWTGSIFWHKDPENAAKLRKQVARHQAWGYPTRLISAEELGNLEKNIVPGEIQSAAFCEQEGSIDPVHATQLLLDIAEESGAEIHCPAEVISLEFRAGRLRAARTGSGEFPIDILVIAAGADTPRLASMAGLEVPLKDAPGVLTFTKPTSRLIERVLRPNEISMLQMVDGRIVIGSGFSYSADASAEQGRRMIKKAAEYLPALRQAELDQTTLGRRPIPVDSLPIVGFDARAPDIYLAVMHSGVTLGPLIGELASLEILDGTDVELLAPYRFARF